jgi:hypothetical protein
MGLGRTFLPRNGTSRSRNGMALNYTLRTTSRGVSRAAEMPPPLPPPIEGAAYTSNYKVMEEFVWDLVKWIGMPSWKLSLK